MQDAADAIYMQLPAQGILPVTQDGIIQSTEGLRSIFVDIPDIAQLALHNLSHHPEVIAQSPHDTDGMQKIIQIVNGLGQLVNQGDKR